MHLIVCIVLLFTVVSCDVIPIFDGNQAAAAAGDGCILNVPSFPLTPQGLMTPYTLSGPGCDEANVATARYVLGVILNTDTGEINIYNPLVITAGTQVASPPTPVNFTANNHVVGLWLGSNANFLVLGNDQGVANGRCVTGPQGSPFGQFAWCNADVFMTNLINMFQAGKIKVPPLGLAVDGNPCPTVRDFFIIDMDPDDGVTASYIVTTMNNVVQNTKANAKKFQTKTTIFNDSDNLLLVNFIYPAIGCKPMLAADLADPGSFLPGNPLNDLQAIAVQPPPVVLLPNNDPMVTTNNQPDILKLNLYRLGVSQPQAQVLGAPDNDPIAFCKNYANIAPARFKSLANQLKNFQSPANDFPNLFAFMKNRAMGSYAALNCQALTGTPDPFAALQ